MSLLILIGRGLDLKIETNQVRPKGKLKKRNWSNAGWRKSGCAVFRVRNPNRIPVTMAKGSHLFPYRTQKLSLSAPMVLGWRRPGRVGRCRIPNQKELSKCWALFDLQSSNGFIIRAISVKYMKCIWLGESPAARSAGREAGDELPGSAYCISYITYLGVFFIYNPVSASRPSCLQLMYNIVLS